MKALEAIKKPLDQEGRDISEYLQTLPVATEIPFAKLRDGLIKSRHFGQGCSLALGEGAEKALASGAGRLTIQSMRPDFEIDNLKIFIEDFKGHIQVLCGSSGTIVLGRLGVVRLDIRIGHGGSLVIGDGTTVNGARIIAINSTILVGQDGLWSDEILVQGFDQHGIVDLNSGEIVNGDRRGVTIERHVWLGRRSILMPTCKIGEGAIVGTGTIVTKDVPECCAVAGSPGRIVRENVSWSRPWTQLDPVSADFVAQKMQERGIASSASHDEEL